MKDYTVIKDGINVLMEGATTLLIDTTTIDEDKYILFDDFGRGSVVSKPNILSRYSASEISSILYQHLSTPTFGGFTRDDCINRGLFKLDTGDVVTIEIIPISTGFHLWVRKSIALKPTINMGKAKIETGDILVIGENCGQE
ncbi:hypothetical protein OTK49_03075 [Vibrio coralliirubri]|uniref:hypothetical protein n=1 Tax=Vibrio coralliirubri TaxID=1516159 RepID=UPI00228508E8|nr:hypothetical protein [Vibrio coralliirubri]MCY9861498.1 hypothetical protein [Vibrio coralliirubri]